MGFRTFVLIATMIVCLFFGFWSFVYHGYTEDGGGEPVYSWPYGAVLYLIGGAIALVLIRRRWPELSPAQLLAISASVACLLFIAALGSLDAGGNSFEF